MIYGISKFKVATRDWPYVVEYSAMNDGTHNGELITHRTSNRPRPALIENAHRVASLALQLSGLGVLVVSSQSSIPGSVAFGLASVTWSDGDEPGTKVEIHLIGARPLHGTSANTDMKLILEKVNDREEYQDVELGGGLKERRPVSTSESVKNAYIEAVKLLQDQVKAFAEGETEQGELFTSRETAGAAR
jgi:hypothetical protein